MVGEIHHVPRRSRLAVLSGAACPISLIAAHETLPHAAPGLVNQSFVERMEHDKIGIRSLGLVH